MAFSGSSYFAGIGTAFVAIGLGFAGGVMITTSTVQPPNRLERVTSNVPLSSNTAATPPAEQPNATPTQSLPPPPAAPNPAAQPTQPEPVTAGSDVAIKNDPAATTAQEPARHTSVKRNDAATQQSARTEDTAPAKNERAGVRSVGQGAEAYRKRPENRREDRKFVERKRRQDPDDTVSTVGEMRRESRPQQMIVERDEPAAFERRAPHLGFFGDEDDSPRSERAPRPFGFFGN